MSSKKWTITFIITLLIFIMIYAGINICVDPFGVFGDYFFDWYSYNITNNPRASKIAYLEKNNNYKNYDSYLIGCSSTSSFPKESLDKYFGGSWYNMIMYGADMLDVEQTAKYVIDNYDSQNIMVNIYISNGTKYDEESDNITRNMHYKLNGESAWDFYYRYAFLNPKWAFAKIKSHNEDTYLTQPFDVFNVETGAYDKKVRDSESIGDLEEYYKKYEVFKNYPMQENSMTKIDETVASVKRIKDYCDEKSVKVFFVMAPVYTDYLKCFDKNEVIDFHTKVANVTDYWDFTTSSLTYEPRFFYDETHFRNIFGTMCLAKMKNQNDFYYPEDIGEHVNKENVQSHLENILNVDDLYVAQNQENYSTKLNIYTFHSLVENPEDTTEITPNQFEEVVKFFYENGYNTVSLNDLYDYVYKGIDLPQNPVMITFDDGYLTNYEEAFPILKKYNSKATIFIIGSVEGSEGLYKDTNNKMKKHFNVEQAKEMIDSGLVDIQSHTYNMHQWAPFELDRGYKKDEIRENILKLENETELDYKNYLEEDISKMKILVKECGGELSAISYPSGCHDTLSDVVVTQSGIKATFTIEEGVNTIIKGLPQSLYNLKRNNVDVNTKFE